MRRLENRTERDNTIMMSSSILSHFPHAAFLFSSHRSEQHPIISPLSLPSSILGSSDQDAASKCPANLKLTSPTPYKPRLIILSTPNCSPTSPISFCRALESWIMRCEVKGSLPGPRRILTPLHESGECCTNGRVFGYKERE